MTNSLRIAVAQLNITVGDFDKNVKKHIEAAHIARQNGADLIVFPELSITGYPAEDLLLRRDFLAGAQKALQTLIQDIQGIYCLVGHPTQVNDRCHNTCTLFYNGAIITQYHKHHLPNHGVFDECRYFTPGHQTVVTTIKDTMVGLLICEDIWHHAALNNAIAQGATLLVIPNASPFETDKHETRVALLTTIAKQHHVDIVYANLVGGQDELVFDGGSMAISHTGNITTLMPFFKESVQLLDMTGGDNENTPPAKIARIYEALCVGLRDYIDKNNIPGVLLGLSGGIDSALTLAIACDALGSERVHAVMMPSEYTADISKEDASMLAHMLGVTYDTIPITDCYRTLSQTIAPFISKEAPAITYENLQARTRGMILMALSNASGKIVINTGNRSELATGYCTLYGDMVGGFAVLKDVPKTMVYELSEYRNNLHHIIPERILSRAPTAELAPNQKDEDSLPPYAILDQILELYLNQLKSKDQIVTMGFDTSTVEKTIKLVHQNEYKRKQSPIGTHINHKSFNKDWRFPLTNKWR